MQASYKYKISSKLFANCKLKIKIINYSAVKLGARFSKKARTPSLKSAVPKHFENSLISTSKPSAGTVNDALMARIAAEMA